MEAQDIQEKKLSLINWISQLQDISLIEKLTDLQNDEIKIHQWQKDILDERLSDYKNNPEQVLDFDTAMDEI
ncbi:MAG: addiction module protein, partial [Bacteroidales bacterium]|nr:addiction module protein [Bacteroidales bacterium]